MAPTDEELARWEDEGGAEHPQSPCTGESACSGCDCGQLQNVAYPSATHKNPWADLEGDAMPPGGA